MIAEITILILTEILIGLTGLNNCISELKTLLISRKVLFTIQISPYLVLNHVMVDDEMVDQSKSK